MSHQAAMLGVLVVLLAAGTSAQSDGITYLTTDSQHVTPVNGWSVQLGPVRKSAANPLLREDKPWEAAWWNTEPSIEHDGDTWHLFWNSHFECGVGSRGREGMCPHETYAAQFPGFVPTNRNCGTQGGPTCAAGVEYATSKDGVRWIKPSLGLVSFNGSTENNIIISANGTDPDLGFILDHHEKNSSRKWKAFGTGLSSSSQQKGQGCLVDVAFSASPTHWPKSGSSEIHHEGIIAQNDGTADNVRWDDDLKLYIGYVRLDDASNHSYNRRRTGRTTSSDFLHWTKAQQVFQGQHLYVS